MCFYYQFWRIFVGNNLSNSKQINLCLIQERELTFGLQQLYKYVDLTFSDHIAALGNPLLMHRLHQLLNLNSGRIEVSSNGFRISLNHLAYQFTWLEERFFKKSFSMIASLMTVLERKSCRKTHQDWISASFNQTSSI